MLRRGRLRKANNDAIFALFFVCDDTACFCAAVFATLPNVTGVKNNKPKMLPVSLGLVCFDK